MKIGDKYTMTHVVRDDETAEVLGSGGLPVYHLRACRPGTEVIATAEVTEIEGRRICYKVCVSDEKGLMGEGTHERFIIDPERFMAKLG